MRISNLLALGLLWSATLHACNKHQPGPVSASGEVETSGQERGTRTASDAASIRAAVATATRPEADRVRDRDRKPAEVLAFFGVRPGMKVADLMTGRGYYTELLAHAVGADGAVYAHNNRFVMQRFAEKPLRERLHRMGLAHVVPWERELDALDLPEGQLDLVQMVLFYHDTYWQEVDRTAMNRAIYRALAPGGIYGVIDHHALAGTGDSEVKRLHRVEASLVKDEILAAGFEFVGASQVLRHPDDDRQSNVFSAAIRGRTDRFVYKFRKPR